MHPTELSGLERASYLSGYGMVAGLLAIYAAFFGLGIPMGGLDNSLWTIGRDPLTPAGYLGGLACYLSLVPRPRERLVVLVLAPVLEAIFWFHRPDNWTGDMRAQAFGVGIGMAGLLGMGWRAWHSVGIDRARAAGILSLALVFPLFPRVVATSHDLVASQNPAVYDQFGFVVDGLIGFHAPLLVASWLAGHPWLDTLLKHLYFGLPLVLILGGLVQLRFPERCYNNMVLSFMLAGIGGALLYNIVPMVGFPFMMGSRFPNGPDMWLTAPPQWIPAPVDLPRNCMPSLHLGWALLVVFSISRTRRWVAALAVLVAVGTALSTMRWGAHYLIDLPPAFPFSVVLMAATAAATPFNKGARAMAVGVGALLLGTDLVIIRMAFPWLCRHAGLFFGLQAVMVAGSMWLENRLAAATLGRRVAPSEQP